MTRRIINFAFLFLIAVSTIPEVSAQTPNRDEAVTPAFHTQVEFVGKETYEVNGEKGTRYKLSVTNRASHPDFLWHPSADLPPCGKNENAVRTWVEIFGSPGDKRLNGFCALRSSDDLGQLWFAVPSGEKGPPCVYLVMTDRKTGRRYRSERVCSRLFTVTTGLKAGGQSAELAKQRREQWIELTSTQAHQSSANTNARNGDVVFNASRGQTVPNTGSSAPRGWDPKRKKESPNSSEPGRIGPSNKSAGAAQPDLKIKQFLFPPTNDKALRVQVVNSGGAPSGACRLVITLRKINGVPAGRKTHVNVPPLSAGEEVWLVINANIILPNNVSLKSTTFKLNVDATEIITESDEANNELWHNL